MKRAEELINFVENSDLIIMNDGSATRISPIFNVNNSVIDLTIVSIDLISQYTWSVADSPYGSDDIPTLLASAENNFTTHSSIIWDLQSTNWDVFNEMCELRVITDDMTIDEMDEIINKQILTGLYNSTHYFKYPNNKKRSPPW